MALFVDLDEESEPPQARGYHRPCGVTPEWNGGQTKELPTAPSSEVSPATLSNQNGSLTWSVDPAQQPQPAREISNQNAMTEALGCYPIVMAIASSLDLNSLDNLSRTCWQVHQALLQYRVTLLTHTLHCENEDIPIDPEDTFRYRARAGNWFYMEDGRGDYNGKSGSCARDMVAECRRCARVVCRNCAIKPPAPVVLRDRHRRLCIPCSKAPLGSLVRPALRSDTPIDADEMQRAICTCVSEGVWLCQPCGRSIRGADHEYQSIWKWRSQYGEVIGGLGTGIGEGDRGVICGRGEACCAAREREQETDCDAEDAREVDLLNSGAATPQSSFSFSSSSSSAYAVSISSGGGGGGGGGGSSPPPHAPSSRARTPEADAGANPAATANSRSGNGSPSSSSSSWLPPLSSSPDHYLRRTPTPSQQQRPGYARHEIEGIGGVVKTKLVRIVRVGACVPEWEDEKHGSGGSRVLGREVAGSVRSWCGWCWRVIPGKKDLETAGRARAAAATATATATVGSNIVIIINNNDDDDNNNNNGNQVAPLHLR